MYIPDFWCGVGALFIIEIMLMIIYSIYKNFRR